MEEETAGKLPKGADTGNNNKLLRPLIPWDKLPPMREPRYRTQRNESLCGISIVTGIAAVLVGLTHGIALTVGYDIEKDPVAWWIIFCLIYGEALLAMLLLAALLLVDPGVVKRSSDTCYPYPPSIDKWLQDGAHPDDKPLDLYFPSLVPDCNDTYCARCLVWRRARHNGQNHGNPPKACRVASGTVGTTTALQTTTTETITTTIVKNTIIQPKSVEDDDDEEASVEQPAQATATTTTQHHVTELAELPSDSDAIKYFHCNTCQRCVRHFDHHCSIFGRCIAGSPKAVFTGGGNLIYFYVIIGVGGAAYLTCLACVLAGLLNAYSAKWVVPFFLCALFMFHCMNPMLQRTVFGLGRAFCRCC